METHFAWALAASSSSTDLGRGNESAKNAGTFCVGDDCEIHVVKNWTNDGRTCEM